jgi:hypothetical protein
VTKYTSREYAVNKLDSEVDALLPKRALPRSRKVVAAETFFTPRQTLPVNELNP